MLRACRILETLYVPPPCDLTPNDIESLSTHSSASRPNFPNVLSAVYRATIFSAPFTHPGCGRTCTSEALKLTTTD
jgi:hypothetical protein